MDEEIKCIIIIWFVLSIILLSFGEVLRENIKGASG